MIRKSVDPQSTRRAYFETVSIQLHLKAHSIETIYVDEFSL